MKTKSIYLKFFSRSFSTSRQTKAGIAVAASPAQSEIRAPFYQAPVKLKATEISALAHQQQQLIRERTPLTHADLDYTFVGCSGGEIMHDLIVGYGIKEIFVNPGTVAYGGSINFFNPLFTSSQLKAILPRHEQGAGHMAEGYARATGKPGVIFVTSGSGITNIVTPLQDALSDGTPMVVFCGPATSITNHPTSDEFQETDVLGVTKSCTKWNIRVTSIAELSKRIHEAFEIAVSGRPGPVLLEIPRHVSDGLLTHAPPKALGQVFSRRLNAATLNTTMNSNFSITQTLDRVAHLVSLAKRPVIYAGAGMLASVDGPKILAQFTDKTLIPVTTSLQSLGAFDELDPKALHMLGLHGSAYANMAMQNADLIIALGARFDDRITGSISKFAPEALRAAKESRGGIVHFEMLAKNVNKVVQATEVVLGDCATNLASLFPRVAEVAERTKWMNQIQDWKRRWPLDAYKAYTPTGGSEVIKAQAAIEMLSDLTADRKDRMIVTTGVGQHQMFAAQHLRWRHSRTMLTSGGLGTMGYGLPAAIGARIARPECLVVDIDGDASFNMTLSELATAAKYNIDVKVLLCNNDEMGMVVDLQRLYFRERFHHTRQKNPDFVKVSQAFGVQARRCSKVGELEEMMKWLLETNGPAVLEVMTERNSPVWPVVPAGKALHEFVTYPEVRENKASACQMYEN